MMDFWNSIDQLSRLQSYVQAVVVILGIVTGLLAGSSFVISHRKSSLESARKAAYEELLDQVETRTSQIQELSQRALSHEMKRKIAEMFVNVPTARVLVIMNNSKESRRYSGEFERLLENAGWTVEHFFGSSLRKPHKMELRRNDKYVQSEAFSRLIEAFTACKLEFESGEFQGDFNHEMIFDPGVVQANEYQEVLDKIE